MALEGRQHRKAPARPGPNRAAYPVGDAINGAIVDTPEARPQPDADAARGHDAVILDAVSSAYRVVDDNVREGRRAAERLRAAPPPSSEPPPNAMAVANRLLHVTRDLGATWVDLIVAVLREPEVRAMVDRLSLQDRPRAQTSPAGWTAPTSVTHRVKSRKPVEVTLSPMPALNLGAPPGVAGLHAIDPASPPIRGVAFSRGPDGGLEVEIEVPDDHPADVYSGAVVDMESRRPIGTLTVRVLR